MKKRNPMIRALSVVLVLCMVISLCPTAHAWSFADLLSNESGHALSIEKLGSVDADVKLELEPVEHPYQGEKYAETDTVRVSIVLKDKPAMEKFSTKGIASNVSAQAYRQTLREKQAKLTAAIEQRALKGEKLDVVWNMTLAANIISAYVPYGSIDEIAAVVGVADVVIEEQYEAVTAAEAAQPFQSTATGMFGAPNAWAAGYTGAGTRIAIIDTGLDTDHQSFSAGAFRYALEQQAAQKGVSADAYIQSLDLLNMIDVEDVLKDLNIYPYIQYNDLTNSGAWYVNQKVPFAINYVDRNYRVTHDYDGQGGHGSHVAGIAAANRFIPTEDGYVSALDSVLTQGVAPDAQLVIMKVFGENGGAFDSDYMVAIEDAIMLGCDVVNLSLGSNKGFARSRLYQHILDSLSESDTVVAVDCGNSGAWADYSGNGMSALYGDDVDFSVIGAPGTATNSLAVASVDNIGSTDYYIEVAGQKLYYARGVANNAYTKGLNAIGGVDRTYVLVDGIGTPEDAAAAAAAIGDPSQAILAVSRGEINFSEKANNASNAGFAGCIIYNNVEGSISMDLTDYVGSGPAVSVSKANGDFLRASAVQAAEGIYVGTMYVSDEVTAAVVGSKPAMSTFSSWGVAGNLELKPEITAPGGNIYSVNGEIASGDAYMNNSGTSMAAPQIAGMAALVMQYIREENLAEKTGMSPRALTNSLLMATAKPLVNEEKGGYYAVLQQGSGLADVSAALSAGSYILMDGGVNAGAADGKVKAELGDDPAKDGVYNFGFTINNFSDTVKTYALSSDFFTQELYEIDGISYHGNATVDLPAMASYTVGSEEISVSSTYACDLNCDGLTDAADAQIILEHAAGTVADLDAKADLNGDGMINSYDAHLILASLRSGFFSVKPGEKVHVQVKLELTDKAALESYVSGAYIEGFVSITSAPDAEGLLEPEYSIPVLGFYGNWTDGSMYDRADYTDYIYDDFIFPYTGGLNYLSMFEGINERYFVGNPYRIEDTFPADRAALHPDTELGDMAVTLIRNAAGFLFYVLDGEGNIVDARSGEQLQAAYYYEAYGAWMNITNVGLSIWETPEQMGFKHGDKFTIGFMAVPEYYENGGTLTTEDLVDLYNSGRIGKGALHSYTFAVDEAAPLVEKVEKDPETGDLIITAADDNFIAAISVLNAKGSSVLTTVGAERSAAGETVSTTVDMEGISVNRDCIVMVADYAGNESFYTVKDYNEGINDFGGRIYGFSNNPTRGNPNSFLEIDPSSIYYYTDDLGEVFMGGTSDFATMPWQVVAAEYVGGYVFMATADGKLYAAEQGDWETCYLVGESKNYAKIKDMAYSYADGKLYALIGTANTIYSIDLSDGYLTKEYTVSLSFPRNVSDANYELLAMTIDDEGNFYAVNNGDSNDKRAFLFTWKNTGGNITGLTPVNNTAEGYLGDYVYNDNANYMGDPCYQSMAWDHDNDILYYAAAMSPVSPSNLLYTIDTATGKTSVATGPIEGVAEYALGVLSCNISSLYVVPQDPGRLPTTDYATGIQLNRDSIQLLTGSQFQLLADVFPWNISNKAVNWVSYDESVVTVDENGLITAVGAGETFIVATTAAQPGEIAACSVTVSDVKNLALNGLMYDAEGNGHWISFNTKEPESFTVTADCTNTFLGGGFLEDTVYVHDGYNMYAVDANTFEVRNCGYVDSTWLWSDGAPAPKNSLGYFDRIVGVLNGGRSFGVMDVETGIASELPEYYYLKDDHAAVIAYKGDTTFTDEYGTYPAYEYYVLTEQGTLMVLMTYAFYDSDLGSVMYDNRIETIGETGLRLLGVSNIGSGKFGSMHYDAVNDYLIVSIGAGSETTLYAFQPDVCAPVELGTFGEDNMVFSLYSYSPYSDLAVTVDPAEAEIYVGESLEMTAKVYNYDFDDSVIWSSSDESIATVDASGVVRALAAGDVVITATSTEGEASASATITVKPVDSMDVKLHAYITTAEGGRWVRIDGSDMTVETLAESDAYYTGAGAADGKIYATDESYYYEIDVQNGYTVTQGDKFTDGDGHACLYMLDGTSAPKTTVTLPDLATGEDFTAELGGKSVYISGYDGSGYHYLTMLEDYTTGKYSVSPIEYTYNPAAIAYKNSEIIENNYYFDFYLVLGFDGLIETYSLYSSVSGGSIQVAGGWENDAFNTGLEFEDGDDVSMTYVKNDAFEGVIISHVDKDGVSLYSFDVNTHVVGKLGNIPGATDLVGLSLMTDVGYAEEPEEPDVPDVPDVPVEPEGDDSLLGYLAVEEGYVWAKIDPENGTYEVLASDTVDYTGGGFANGMFYTSYGETKYGNTTYKYYEIDPSNGFAASVGTTCAGTGSGYTMVDGTGTPAVEADGITAGGYYVYAANGKYSSSAPKVYVVSDYQSTATELYIPSSAFSGKQAAMCYIGGEKADDSYQENFLILGQNGTMYSCQLVTTASGLYGQANVATVGTLDLNAMSGASMTMTGEDTLTISVNADDGVVLYEYTISTGELTELAVIEEAVKLGSLTKYTEVYGEPEQPEEPVVPEEPETESSLLGYVAIEEGYAWAKIDPADGTYEVVAEGTLDYTGGGLSGDKLYTSYGETKYGNTTYKYYMVDPANGFAAAVGNTCAGSGYTMADGTGTPAVTAELSTGTVNVGGYYVYAANGKYSSSAPKVYVLHNYAASETTEPYVSSSAFSGKLAAICYIGGENAGDSYLENFLILGQNGTMYSYQLVTNASGLYGAANVSTVGTLDLSAMNGASMTLTAEDTLTISVNADDGVVLYRYTISSGELVELSTITDAVKLGCLSVYDEAVPALERIAAGSTLAVSGEHEVEENTVTVKLTEDVAVTNGVIEVTYDANELTYVGASSMNASYAVNDSVPGKLVIAYASGDAIDAGAVIAALRFSFEGSLYTEVTVTVTERNDAFGLSESETIRLGEAEVEVIATGWSGYTNWRLTSDGTLTFVPTEQKENGQTNLKNYWKVNGVLTLPWTPYAEMITKVVIEEGIHDIGQMAFYELPNLVEVRLPESAVEIRSYAFKNCKSLTTINLEVVEFIREGAFYGCSALENVSFADDVVIEDWAFSKTPVALP